MIYTIYKITNTITGKVYIGFDSDYPNRIRIHKSASKSGNTKFYRAVRKYGWEQFKHEAIYQSWNRDNTLNVMETYFISEYDSYNNGYNSTRGGDGCFGLLLSEEAKHKISLGNKQKPKQDKKWIEKRIYAGLETRAKNKELGKSYSLSTERKQRISDKTKGISKPFSKQHLESVRKSMAERNSVKITCPHCLKEGQSANMKRWHFDRCKLIPQGLIIATK